MFSAIRTETSSMRVVMRMPVYSLFESDKLGIRFLLVAGAAFFGKGAAAPVFEYVVAPFRTSEWAASTAEVNHCLIGGTGGFDTVERLCAVKAVVYVGWVVVAVVTVVIIQIGQAGHCLGSSPFLGKFAVTDLDL
jgi:hypothetical protein